MLIITQPCAILGEEEWSGISIECEINSFEKNLEEIEKRMETWIKRDNFVPAGEKRKGKSSCEIKK